MFVILTMIYRRFQARVMTFGFVGCFTICRSFEIVIVVTKASQNEIAPSLRVLFLLFAEIINICKGFLLFNKLLSITR